MKLRQLAHYRKPKPKPSVLTSGRAIGLAEGLKKARLRLRRDTNPGVVDLDSQLVATAAGSLK